MSIATTRMSLPTIRTRVFEMREELDITTDARLGLKIGMSQRSVNLVRLGRRMPHNQFIAGVLAAYPSYTFEQLFRLEFE